jgi:hypothetical protein
MKFKDLNKKLKRWFGFPEVTDPLVFFEEIDKDEDLFKKPVKKAPAKKSSVKKQAPKKPAKKSTVKKKTVKKSVKK